MKSLLMVLVASVSLSSSAQVEKLLRPWESYSNPSQMSSSFQKTFTALPLKGTFADPHKLWSSDYWPFYKGNINYRWNAPHPTGFNLRSPSKDEARAMTQDQLAQLAPSEKFDLMNGRYDYPLKKEVAGRSSPSTPSWMGICNGWAPAALNHDEPHPMVVTNPDGIQVPFGSSDIKAILSYYYAFVHRVDSTHQMGYRCKGLFTDNCNNDMNAGAFHVVLANRVGLEGASFIADIDRGSQVWNHPAYDYQATVLNDNLRPSSNSARGTVKRIRVQNTVRYVFEIPHDSWDPAIGTGLQRYTTKNYTYDLDIDGIGNIIGGDWVSKERPDFLWTMSGATSFPGYYARLSELLAH